MTQAQAHGAFTGQVVLVTGASSGVGAALARGFAAAGADVALCARSEPNLERVAAACGVGGREALLAPCDVTSPQACIDAVERVVERFGYLDVVVACAGQGMSARFDELADARVLGRLMEVNYHGVVNVFLPALPLVRARRGMLVAISSIQGVVGVPGRSGYAASKHAVQGLCDSLRLELRGTGVDVLTVLAHWVRGTELRARALGPDGAPSGTRAAAHDGTAIDVDTVTRAVLRAIERRKRCVFLPHWMRLLALLSALAPGLADRLIAGWMAKQPAADRWSNR